MINKRIDRKLKYLGLNMNSNIFVIIRLVSSLILLFVFLLSDYGYIVSPIISIVYYITIELIILDCSIYRRKNELENDAIEFFDFLNICLKNDRNLKKAISYTTCIIDSSLSLEFKNVLYDIKIGKSMDEALNSLKQRIPSTLINNIIVTISESNRLGNDVSKSINEQVKYLEDKKNNKVLSFYKSIPLKLGISSIIFIVFVLLFFVLCTL